MSLKITEHDKDQLLACLARSMFRLQSEFMHMAGLDKSHSFFTPNLLNFPAPRGWRLEIWKKLMSTSFKKIADYKFEEGGKSVGVLIGLISTISEAMDSFGKEDEILLDEGFQLAGYKDEDFECDEYDEDPVPIDLTYQNLVEHYRKNAPLDLNNFILGYAEGRTIMFSDPQTMMPTRYTDATVVYFWFLIFGDYIQKMSSVRRVYELAKMGFDHNEMPHSLEAFQKICFRIKFKGHSSRRNKRRINGQPSND